MLAVNLADPSLFGNDAGEDEDPKILAKYFLDKPAFAAFSDPNTRIAIARARKGMGKSALLAKVAHVLRTANPDRLHISVRASDLTGLGEFTSTDPAVLINQWQQVICALINIEIGRRIGFAGNDTKMMMVESSELAGMKSRNLVGALVDRLRGRLGPVEVEKLRQANALWLTQNFEREDGPINAWLFVDDIDATFLNRPELCLKIATFFSACRKLVADVAGLNIRASVRTDVWTSIRRLDESLDKCEQYTTDIRWSATEAERILINKIFALRDPLISRRSSEVRACSQAA